MKSLKKRIMREKLKSNRHKVLLQRRILGRYLKWMGKAMGIMK